MGKEYGAARSMGEPLPSIRGALGKRILVVEDSPSARKLLQELLLRLGVSLPDLRLAATAAEALQLFASWEPQIVFVDLQLTASAASAASPPPNGGERPVNGADLVGQLLQRNPGVKVIICSASQPDGTILTPLIRSGRVLSMMKPVLASKLAGVLAEATTQSTSPPTRGR